MEPQCPRKQDIAQPHKSRLCVAPIEAEQINESSQGIASATSVG